MAWFGGLFLKCGATPAEPSRSFKTPNWCATPTGRRTTTKARLKTSRRAFGPNQRCVRPATQPRPAHEPGVFLVLTGPSCDVQSVAKVRRASDAIAAAITAGHVFDRLRMNLQMSVLDGLSASALLRLTHGQSNRPWIIALNVNALDSDHQGCPDTGRDDCLSNPIRTAGLSKALNRANAGLEKRRAAVH